MTWFDYVVLVIVLWSVVISFLHGLVRELIALVSWVVAFLMAQSLAGDFAVFMPASITQPSLRMLAAFLVVFVLTLAGLTLMAILLSRLIRGSGLEMLDRMLGAVFGLVRGLAIVMLAVLLAGLTALPKDPAWKQAVFSPPLVTLAKVAKLWLPNDLSKRISYD